MSSKNIFDIQELREAVFKDPGLSLNDKVNAMLCCKAWYDMCLPFLWRIIVEEPGRPKQIPDSALARYAYLIRYLRTNNESTLTDRLCAQSVMTEVLTGESTAMSDTGCYQLRELVYRLYQLDLKAQTGEKGQQDQTGVVANLIKLNPHLQLIKLLSPQELSHQISSWSSFGKAILNSSRKHLRELSVFGLHLSDSSLEEVLFSIPTLCDLQLRRVTYDDSVFSEERPWKPNRLKRIFLGLKSGAHNTKRTTSGLNGSGGTRDRIDLILAGCVCLKALDLQIWEPTSVHRLPDLFSNALSNVEEFRFAACYFGREALVNDLGKYTAAIIQKATRTPLKILDGHTSVFGVQSCRALVQSYDHHRVSLEELRVYSRTMDEVGIGLILENCTGLKVLKVYPTDDTMIDGEKLLKRDLDWVCHGLKWFETSLVVKMKDDNIQHGKRTVRRLVDKISAFLQLEYLDLKLKAEKSTGSAQNELGGQVEDKGKEESGSKIMGGEGSEISDVTLTSDALPLVMALRPCSRLSTLRLQFDLALQISHGVAGDIEKRCLELWPTISKIQILTSHC